MAIVFRYLHVPRDDGTLRHAPYIPIHVRTRSGRLIKVVALVDSGADETVLPYDLARLIGLEGGEEISTGGIGGSVPVRESRFKFRVKKDRENYILDVPALIMQEKDADIPLILGRHGFFEQFHITFRQNQEKIVLKKVSEQVY